MDRNLLRPPQQGGIGRVKLLRRIIYLVRKLVNFLFQFLFNRLNNPKMIIRGNYLIFLNSRFHLTPLFQLIQISQASPTT